ncbi:MAG: SAM-dependent methyltransferase [Deltaproteobacteria bacterium]|nr:SAM-dependent methyltransferase [Deltaproteobacteria bacterium]
MSTELVDGVSAELLKALHILTRDGDLNADSRRKLKQVSHFLGLLKPALDDVRARHPDPVVVDCGAGKAYLGLLLASWAFAKPARGRVINVESKQELVTTAQKIAKDAGLERVDFVRDAVETAALPERVHLVTALHACDTATDDALFRALCLGADHIAVVPCCQAEVAQQLKGAPESELSPLYEHGLHRRELGSHLTNVLRCLVLEAHGYQVTVTELVGWEHSLKNELILARRVHKAHAPSQKKLDALLKSAGVRPKLVRLLDARAPSQPPPADGAPA